MSLVSSCKQIVSIFHEKISIGWAITKLNGRFITGFPTVSRREPQKISSPLSFKLGFGHFLCDSSLVIL